MTDPPTEAELKAEREAVIASVSGEPQGVQVQLLAHQIVVLRRKLKRCRADLYADADATL